ncbi:MAG: thymidylate synthase [Lachnospiraceae bacterium]|nr:thymidylate synthase [Lachnospiraceae bacterium]
MSKADEIFINMCRDILDNGTDTKGEQVRPHWPDGSSAYTVKKFGVVNRYDLREEFPALTLRKTAIKSATDEVLWIYQKKSNNIHDLHSHIWDEWADPDGSIGTAYGYVVGEKFMYKGEETDQMDYVLRQLKENPYSRRIMTNLYQFHDLSTGKLDPCCYSATYNVTHDTSSDKLVLNMVLNQRSQDVLAANNWNVVQYAVLLMMVAQVNDMIPGELVHVIADAHIYDRHVPIIEELITRETHPAPRVHLNPDVHDFYEFTRNDVIVEDYVTGPQVEDIPIAI